MMKFILALLGFWTPTTTAPTQFSGNDFYDCTINESPMNETDVPIVFGDDNVAWPSGWTKEKATMWRKEHGLKHGYTESAHT